MSWLFSQALVAEYLEGSCSDGKPFALLNGTLMPQAYLPQDRMMDFSRPSRFGMTFAPLTERLGAELLTWFLAGFHARTSAQPEKAQELAESEAGYGVKWHELSVRYDRDSSSWRTHHCLWVEDLPWSSVILPRWGSMRNGVCSERMTLAHRTAANDAGLWATPSATDGKRGGTITENMTGVSLAQMVKTPMRWPTPTAMTNTGGAALCKWGGSGARAQLRKMVTPQELNGALNPVWVEKLMGWPDEWTSLQPMSHVRMCFWLMGFCDGEEAGRTQVLRVLRKGHAAKEIQRAIGRPVGIREAAILLSEVCEYANRPHEARVFMACSETLEKEVRSVRLFEGIAGAPHRPGQDEQRAGEHSDAMQALSRLLAYHGKAYWQDGRWEDAIARVENGVAARVDRLTAIGNGQVPQCAAQAWRILTANK